MPATLFFASLRNSTPFLRPFATPRKRSHFQKKKFRDIILALSFLRTSSCLLTNIKKIKKIKRNIFILFLGKARRNTKEFGQSGRERSKLAPVGFVPLRREWSGLEWRKEEDDLAIFPLAYSFPSPTNKRGGSRLYGYSMQLQQCNITMGQAGKEREES